MVCKCMLLWVDDDMGIMVGAFGCEAMHTGAGKR